MLPEELVSRDLAGKASTWRVTFISWLNSSRKIVEDFFREKALELSEVEDPQECIVWKSEDQNAQPPILRFYFSFFGVKEPPRVMERLEGGSVENIQVSDPIPEEAIPVLKQKPDGTLIRLWPAPGPDVREKQRLTVEGDRFTIYNRVYKIEGESSQPLDQTKGPGDSTFSSSSQVDAHLPPSRALVRGPRIRIGEALKKIEPKLREIGFVPDPEYNAPRSHIWAYARKNSGQHQGIWFQRSRWAQKITAQLTTDPYKPEFTVRIGQLSDYRMDYWWDYDSQESLENALDEIMALILDRGEKWFRGEIDLEEWMREGSQGEWK